jgi:hypothetical protein
MGMGWFIPVVCILKPARFFVNATTIIDAIN